MTRCKTNDNIVENFGGVEGHHYKWCLGQGAPFGIFEMLPHKKLGS